MKGKSRILVDVDGVIADFVSGFMELYRHHGGHVPDGFKWTDWDSMDELPDQEVRDVVWRDPYLFRILDPYPGAIKALEQLNNHYDVRIVTAIPHMHVWPRSEWFRKHAPFIHRKDQMIFTNDKSIINGDFLIDDSLDNIRAWIAAGRGNAVIVDRPWNQVDRWDEIGIRVAELWEFNERIGIAWEEENAV